MRYLCLAYEEEAKLDALASGEWRALRAETLEYLESLKSRGHYVAAAALQSARSAVTLRVRHGSLAVTDGPFAETKEQLGGFFMLEARDLNEAIRLAEGWPSARLGTIEVRPIAETLPIEGRYAPADTF